MFESDTIDFSKTEPNTIFTIKSDLEKLGVTSGMTLIVHSSLSSIGWVSGGSTALILGIENCLGKSGTLVMPSHSSDLSDPSAWCNPPVPEKWWDIIRETMPAFSTDLTPTREMGTIAETFRKQKGVIRSNHPCSSFSAWGKYKKYITNKHSLNFSLGKDSPLGKIYKLDGYILLLGVGHNRNTSLHLAEYFSVSKSKKNLKCSSPIIANRNRKWETYDEIDYNCDDFEIIGRDYCLKNEYKNGFVGNANAVLIRQKSIVDFAVEWMNQNRK